MGELQTYTCGRCGTAFPITATHTEIIRRDFVEMPHPSRIDRLCVDCWQAYIEEFLDRDFQAILNTYDAESPISE